jgi:plastocyanin
VAADGSIHVNQKAITPSGMPAQAPPSDPNAPPPLDGGTWDGQGFFSTGFLNNPFTFRLTFSKPGTYTYKCLIHDNMEGTIKVGS